MSILGNCRLRSYEQSTSTQKSISASDMAQPRLEKFHGMQEWSTKAGRSAQLLPVPLSRLGGWHPDVHRALCSLATAVTSREMSTFSSTKRIRI